MAVNFRALSGATLIIWAVASTAHGQTASAELDVTGGRSGEEVKAAAAQGRVFGEAGAGINYFAEAAWGQRWSSEDEDEDYSGGLIGADPMGTDVFGAAYPYNKRMQVTEAYAERFFHPRGAMLGVRAGQFRTPFGIYSRSDYGYSGFIRPPLIRYDGYFALSNNYYERGATFTAGIPRLFVEASLGRPHDIGSSHRRAGTDGSIRAQGYYRAFIIGVSHARSNPYFPQEFAFGRQAFTGVDARFAHSSGVQLRGEFLRGRSFTGVSTTGGYVDGSVHHVGMGPFTAVARGESLVYTASAPFARSGRRLTVGARVRLPGYLTAQVNYVRQGGDLPRIHNNSLDFTVTYSLRYR
jgi:hypothetical protein